MKKGFILFFFVTSTLALARSISPGYKFKTGQKLEYNLEQNQHIKMVTERFSGEIDQSNNYRLFFEVKEVNKYEVNFIFKILDVKIKVTQSDQGLKMEPDYSPQIDSVIHQYILNRSYFVRMDLYGNIVSVTPPDFTFKAFDMDTLQYDALMEFSQKENIRTLVDQVFMIYPRNNILPNDSWNNTDFLDAGLPVSANYNLHISDATKNQNVFALKGFFQSGSGVLMEVENPTNTKIKGGLLGKIKTDRKKGWVLNKSWKGSFEGETWVDNHKVLMKNELHFKAEKTN